MSTLREKLAGSLEELRVLQDKGVAAIKSSDLSRANRERLLKNGFIKEVTKGWYIAVAPDEKPGDTTSWYSSYWSFCAQYLTVRFKQSYYLSPEHSLSIHSGNRTVPHQLIVRAVKGSNGIVRLLSGTTLFIIKSSLPKSAQITIKEGLRILSPASSLIHCSTTVFNNNPTDVRAVLSLIKDSSEVLSLLLEGGHSKKAGLLAGAFRNINQNRMADEIDKTMQSAGYSIREVDPFINASPIAISIKEKSPYANRIKLLWHQMREDVIKYFPKAPGLPKDHKKYMKLVEEIYVTDAYHSLSIEKYKVSPNLIERVRSGNWNSKKNDADKDERNAMAARGYWQATQKVRLSIEKILKGRNPGIVADSDHGDWYRELFAPSVAAGIIKASDLAGYRNTQVYIGGSMHVPLHAEAVRDAMPVLFELLENETEASVRAVLGHFIFVYIHPYFDGNGRMGRFLMNAMLASGGYPWTVIPVEERKAYMSSLEKASVGQDIKPFAKLLGYLAEQTLKGKPVAKIKG